MRYIAAYGSLRPGEFNYDYMRNRERFSIHPLLPTSTVLKGFKLYDLGLYPGAWHTGNMKDELVTDILVTNEPAYAAIYNMEIGAGYHEQVIEFRGLPLIIYHLSPALWDLSKFPVVEHGDWSRYVSENKKLANTP